MSSVVISGDTSGTVTVAAPAVAGSNTLTLQAATATNAVNTLATAVASTSGTSIDFTGLPAWVKRITVMLSGVSTSGTSNIQIQLGTGSTTYTTTGYSSIGVRVAASLGAATTATTGFIIQGYAATDTLHGNMFICLVTGNTWSESSTFQLAGTANATWGGGSIALASALTAVRITTVNGTDTFDAGTVNILYEG